MLLSCFALCAGAPFGRAVDHFPPAELAQIQTDLGLTLDEAAQTALHEIVFPTSNDAWRQAAEARINSHRKAALELRIVDRDGQPLVGATVEFRPKTRPFIFGGVLDLKMLDGTSPTQPAVPIETYKARAVAMFDGFGLNNGLKPKQRTGNEALLPGFFSWAAAVQRPVRGHLLIWPGNDHLSAPIEAKVIEIESLVTARDATTDPAAIAAYNTQIDALKPPLRQAVDAEITEWASRWNVSAWDVMNEPLSNTRLQAILGESEMARWYQLAAAARVQPDATLLVNDFQIISGTSTSRIAPYRAVIDLLLAQAAPLSGIGFQSRFKFRREDPAAIYNRIEQFAGYQLPLYGTEFEVVDNTEAASFVPGETLRAQMTEELMTLYFSHPLAAGLYAWSYITPDRSAALLDSDGMPKLNGLVWYYLNRIRYATRGSHAVGSTGSVSLRVFKGTYDLVVHYGGAEATLPLAVTADAPATLTTPFTSNVIARTTSVAADTFVRRDQPNTNYGANSFLDLRRSDGSAGRLAYLRFVVPPAIGDVTAARLKVKIPSTVVASNGETDPIALFATTDASAWDETALTWANRPATGALLATAQGAADVWLEFDVPTSVIPAAGGSVTLILDEQGATYGRLQSREASFAATLTVVESIDHDGDGIPDETDPDDDGDGTPDAWETAFGFNPRVADAGLDSDNDGRSNLLEYVLGRDPTVAEPLGRDIELQATAGGFRLQWRRRTADQRPAVGFSTNLISWQPLHTPADFTAAQLQVESNSIDPDGDTHELVRIDFHPPVGMPNVFFRLQLP